MDDIMFENLQIAKVDPKWDKGPKFVVYCKDRASNEERWVVVPLETEEAKQLYKYLGRYFSEN